jgi:2-polyprenyl-6-methoxyphenol hydroxylase-like FAD-dependent oxidoreductase
VKPVDVLIIGAGPAGLATAIAAARKGLRVAVLDSRKPPIDKTCGEGLMPAAVAALGELGITINPQLGIPFKRIRFADSRSSVSAPILRGCGIGVRRRALHNLLIERATALGVSICWGARISGLQSNGVWAGNEFRRCCWLIGADGQNSTVRKFAGLDPAKRPQTRFGFRQHFAVAPWSDAVEVHWGRRVQMIVTPTRREEVCVVVLAGDPRLRIEQAIEQFPEVSARLRGTAPLSAESGTITCLSRARAAIHGNVALVGDASCTMDGISGSGLSLAFQEANALADALAHEDLVEYQRAHARITRVPVRMTQLLLAMDANAALRRVSLRTLAWHPWLFARLISVHAGYAAKIKRSEWAFDVRRHQGRLRGRVCEPS